MSENPREVPRNVEKEFSHSHVIFKKEKIGEFQGEDYVFIEKDVPYLHIDVGGESYDENLIGFSEENIQVLRKFIEALVTVSAKESLKIITPAIKTKVNELLLIPNTEGELADPTEDFGTGVENFPASPTNPRWPPR